MVNDSVILITLQDSLIYCKGLYIWFLGSTGYVWLPKVASGGGVKNSTTDMSIYGYIN